MLDIIEGKYLKAIDQLEQSLACSDEVGEWVSNASIILNIADAYSRSGDHELSFQSCQMLSTRFLNLGQLSGAAHALSYESMNALRYSDIEHAQRTRQECLALYQQDRNILGETWATWEMSEIYRVSGDLEKAAEWFERARVLFEKFEGHLSVIFIERSQAEFALWNGDHTEAQMHFEQSALHAKQMNHKWALSYALCGWGRAEVELGEFESAQQHFIQAIQNAREIDEYDLVLNALAGFTKILVVSARPEQAAELGTWITNHNLCWNETKSQVKPLLKLISLSPDRLSEAVEQSKHLDFEKAISQVVDFPAESAFK